MPAYQEHPKLGYRKSFSLRAPGFLTKVLAVITGTALLIGAVAISIAFFAVALTVILVFGGYMWWKTRHLRKELQTWSKGGTVIEGEAVDVSRDRRPGQ